MLSSNRLFVLDMPEAEVHREPRVLTDDEVEKLANEVPARYRALVYMLADTGARPGEVIALKVKNLNGSVRIAEATVEVGGKKGSRHPEDQGQRSERSRLPQAACRPA